MNVHQTRVKMGEPVLIRTTDSYVVVRTIGRVQLVKKMLTNVPGLQELIWVARMGLPVGIYLEHTRKKTFSGYFTTITNQIQKNLLGVYVLPTFMVSIALNAQMIAPVVQAKNFVDMDSVLTTQGLVTLASVTRLDLIDTSVLNPPCKTQK